MDRVDVRVKGSFEKGGRVEREFVCKKPSFCLFGGLFFHYTFTPRGEYLSTWPPKIFGIFASLKRGVVLTSVSLTRGLLLLLYLNLLLSGFLTKHVRCLAGYKDVKD